MALVVCSGGIVVHSGATSGGDQQQHGGVAIRQPCVVGRKREWAYACVDDCRCVPELI